MPLTIHGTQKPTRIRTARGRAFDAAIGKLLPTIEKFQAAGFLGIQKLAKELNEAGEIAPSGKPFSYTTTRRVLRRLAQLGLAKGPLSSPASRQHTAKQRRQ
jgi:hypothetical protein